MRNRMCSWLAVCLLCQCDEEVEKTEWSEGKNETKKQKAELKKRKNEMKQKKKTKEKSKLHLAAGVVEDYWNVYKQHLFKYAENFVYFKFRKRKKSFETALLF